MTPNELNVESYGLNISEGLPLHVALAMAYVPFQKLRSVYEPEVALVQGTIFPELDKPWLGCKPNIYQNNRMPNVASEMTEANTASEYYKRMPYSMGNSGYDERGTRR